MIQEKNTRYSMPSWESAIEAILSNFLPAKFAYTGRLDFQDITQDGFYVASHSRGKFFLLDDFLEAKTSPIFPVYVANLEPYSSTTSAYGECTPVQSLRFESKPEQPTTNNSIQLETQNLQKYMKGADRSSLEEYKWNGSLNTYPSIDYEGSVKTDLSESDHFGKLIPDRYLGEYLENLRKKIAKEESCFGDIGWFCIHPRLVRERARIIAEFVADEMSGPEPNPACFRHYKEMHINELKLQLGTNIFPLGFIKMGDYLERAMLFKVLSDRIGFPCAFVRGSYGRAWIEIAIPVINIEDTENSSIKSTITSSSSQSEVKLSSKETIQSFDSVKSQCESVNVESIMPEESFWFPKLKMECFKAFPNYYLKPNAIVDLVHVPGRIIKLNSREAEEYCGAFLFGKK